MLFDYHVHTAFSDDSSYPMSDCILDAIDLGIDEICFTDHVDYGIKLDWDQSKKFKRVNGQLMANVDYPLYFQTISHYQRLFKGQITLKKGLEFGVQTHTIPLYQALFDEYENQLDFVILSIHQVDDLEFWTQDYQKGKSQKEYIEGYYRQMYDVVRSFHDYSVLGHMDMINRYDLIGNYPFELVKPYIAEILKVVIADEKGIELNTSFHRYGLNDSTPCKAILELYRDLGGKIITIGSDAHSKQHLGAYINEGKAYLKSLGFEWQCAFYQMNPSYYPIG